MNSGLYGAAACLAAGPEIISIDGRDYIICDRLELGEYVRKASGAVYGYIVILDAPRAYRQRLAYEYDNGEVRLIA